MHASRAALIVVGLNLVAVWAAAAAGSRGVATEAPAPQQLVIEEDAVGEARASLLAAADRLAAHARRGEPRPALIRDPFRFGASARPAGRRAAAAVVEAAPEAPARAEPKPEAAPEPDISLQGMAESGDGDALVRTAILRAGGELVLATVGSRVGDRFEVVALTADSVELEDLVAHVRRTWRLK
jgi:hypothetical protein